MNSKYKKIIIVLVILIVILLIVFLFSKNDNILTPINPEYSIELLGEKEITIDQYSEYNELGFSAYYGNKNVNSDVTIESNIDSNVPGTYEVKYIVGDREASRQITVTPIEEDTSGVTGDALIAVYYEISDCELTNDDVLIDFKIVGKDYKQSIMPDDSCSTNNTFTYKIKENGKYDFSFYDINENKKELTLEIDNIDKDIPNGTCEIKKANGNYLLNVESTKTGTYKYNNKIYTLSTYTASTLVTKAVDSITLYDFAGNSKKIDCTIKNNNLQIIFFGAGSDDDAILIRDEETTMFVDGGRHEHASNVVNFLKTVGVKKIDILWGSHPDWNHIQAQAEILKNFQVDKLYSSVDYTTCVSEKKCKSDDVKYIKDEVKRQNKKVNVLYPGDTLSIGDFTFYIIGPNVSKYTTNTNASSLVWIMSYGNRKYMFTGDMEEKQAKTDALLSSAKKAGLLNIKADVFKYPHHGYQSLSKTFFNAISPKYVIVPDHKSCSSFKGGSTLGDLNIPYYRLCKHSNILITSDGESLNVKQDVNLDNYKFN